MNITHEEELIAKELKRAEILTTFLRTHSPTVAPVLDQQLAAVAQEGETMPAAAPEQELKARLLDQGSQELTEVSTVFRDAFADRIQFGDERLAWYATTRGEMFAIQTMVRAQGGQKALDRLGLAGTLADTPEKLLLQGQHFQLRVTRPLQLRTRSGEDTISTATLGQRLEMPLSALELRQNLFVEADQKTAKARKVKNESLANLRLLNQTIGQETIAEFRRAGFQDLAYRLRRQLNRVLKPSNGNTTAPPATDQDGADASPTPDAPPPSTAPDTGSTAPGTVTETPDGTTSTDTVSPDATTA